MNLKRISLIAVTTLAFAACKNATQTTTATNDSTKATMYYGGDIITMEGDSANYAESVVVKDGKIIFVGNKDEAMKAAGDGHNMIDLQGKTMLPGFIDAHGHMVYYGKNLMDQSLTGVKDIPEIIQRMKSHIAQIPGDGWIVGMGYAPLKMIEQRHPTADELDQISMDRPVLVVHASGHGGSMNHALIKL
jgi:predicted amidohydrolase YtcJ